MTPPPSASLFSSRRTALLVAAVFLGALLLYARPLLVPVLSQDDFQILAQSWTWQKTVDGLWKPNNEHAMPLGRLLTFAVVRLAGRPTALPAAGVLVGVLGLLADMGLTYCFVRRELGHPLYGMVAVVLFGVCSTYQQAVYWFAASFSLFALSGTLLALLAAQTYRRTGHWRWLTACGAACAFAPCWFASGVLAGPFCVLYLLPRDAGAPAAAWLRSLPARLAPLLGTAAFLAVSLPLTAPTIQHLEHYGNHTALESFRPLTGSWYAARSTVDNLALGVVGVTDVTVGPVLALPLLAGLVAAGVWWTWGSRGRRLVLLGAGLIFGSYLLIYSARALWDYDHNGLYGSGWGRYHLQPQLGLALLICAGLSGREGRWFHLDAEGRLTRLQVRALALLLGVCFLTQAPRGFLIYYAPNPRQAETLGLIDRAGAFCREHRLSAAAARRELGVLNMPESTTKVNGWEFLRGSDDPADWTPEDVGALLEAPR